MGKDLTLFVSSKKRNKVLRMFDIPYRYGKDLGTIMLKIKKKWNG